MITAAFADGSVSVNSCSEPRNNSFAFYAVRCSRTGLVTARAMTVLLPWWCKRTGTGMLALISTFPQPSPTRYIALSAPAWSNFHGPYACHCQIESITHNVRQFTFEKPEGFAFTPRQAAGLLISYPAR